MLNQITLTLLHEAQNVSIGYTRVLMNKKCDNTKIYFDTKIECAHE